MNHTFVPPMIDGVSASSLYLPKQANNPATVFDFFCQKFAHITANEWQQRFDDGLVLSSDGVPLTIYSPYVHGQTLYYYRFLAQEVVVPFCHEVLFENDEFLVVDKPHFLAVTPGGQYLKQTLLTRLKQQTGNANLSPIHRLDKETAGLILISKNPQTRGLYQSLFANHAIKKVYHAIAPAHDLAYPMSVSLHLERGDVFYVMAVNADKAPNSHTIIHQIKCQGAWAKYELHPTTGKLHQLRVHLNHLGIAIKNDPYYPSICHKADDDFANPLQLLAKRLSFIDPISQQAMAFESKKELYLPNEQIAPLVQKQPK